MNSDFGAVVVVPVILPTATTIEVVVEMGGLHDHRKSNCSTASEGSSTVNFR